MFEQVFENLRTATESSIQMQSELFKKWMATWPGVPVPPNGGCEQFIRDVPNSTVCGAGELLRVGFMNWTDLTGYVDLLKRRGLAHLDSNGEAVDVVIVDVRSGPHQPCNWQCEYREGVGYLG